jgi:hypothetical protein
LLLAGELRIELGDTEVEQLHPPRTLNEQVVRLDVAVNDARVMRRLRAVARL